MSHEVVARTFPVYVKLGSLMLLQNTLCVTMDGNMLPYPSGSSLYASDGSVEYATSSSGVPTTTTKKTAENENLAESSSIIVCDV